MGFRPAARHWPLLTLAALAIGLGSGVATVAFFGLEGEISTEIPEPEVMALPEALAEIRRVPIEPIHGVDRHSLGPGPLPAGVRPHELPPVEVEAAFVERSSFGPIPRRSPDGRLPSDHFAAARDIAEGRPLVAVLVTGLGLHQELSTQALALDPAVAFGVSPYISTAADWQRAMRWHGHETYLMLPLEAVDPTVDDQGALAISLEDDPQAMATGLRKVLSRGAGYVGLATQARSFAEQPERFSALVAEMAGRGLALLELGGSHLAAVAITGGLPYLAVEHPLDRVLRPDAIDAMLAELENDARANGFAAAWTSPIPLVLDRVWRWSSEVEERGFDLVPMSALLEAMAR